MPPFKDMIKDRPVDRAVQVIVIAITLSACGWGAYYNEAGMGDGDWWLEVRSLAEPDKWDRIALVFGTVDDYQACTDIAKSERARVLALGVPYPAEYRCTPAK